MDINKVSNYDVLLGYQAALRDCMDLLESDISISILQGLLLNRLFEVDERQEYILDSMGEWKD